VVSSGCWDPDRFKLFIAHTARRRAKANHISTHLKDYAVSAFVAHDAIEPTRQWQDVIEYALSTAEALVALLTPDFPESKWTDQEVGVVFGRRKLVIPVKLGLDPYGFIGKYQALQGKGVEDGEIARKIFEILAKHTATQKGMAEALVSEFQNSHSFQNANENMTRLERARYLDNVLIRRLRTAAKRNSQIAKSWGVPDRLERLIARLNR